MRLRTLAAITGTVLLLFPLLLVGCGGSSAPSKESTLQHELRAMRVEEAKRLAVQDFVEGEGSQRSEVEAEVELAKACPNLKGGIRGRLERAVNQMESGRQSYAGIRSAVREVC